MNINIEDKLGINIDNSNVSILNNEKEHNISMADGEINITIPEDIMEIQTDISRIETGQGTNNHANLNNLDYENSGHTGFQRAGNYVEDENYTHTDNNYTSEEKSKLEGIEANANNYVLPDDVVKDKNYNHTDNNYTNAEKNKLSNIEANANNYVLPVDVVQDNDYVHTDNNYTDSEKSKLATVEKNANHYVLPSDVVKDNDYTHTDNNFTDADKTKLSGIEANANNFVLPSDVVQDSKYVHTDNNFTNEHKEKLDGLESLSGKAIDISYEDNMGYDVQDVQGALDKAFDTLDNKINYEDFRDDFDQTIGDINDLETEDTSNIVNAINSLVGKGGGIPELSGDINIYDLEQGIYLLSGANTRLLRNTYAFMSKPVLNDYSKSILIFIREAQYGEQGFILKASTAGPYVQLYAFDRTTIKEYNAMQLMSMYNNTSYNVTNTYQPAHKQYVDGQINKLKGELGGIVELGEIDLQEWDDDMDAFMGSLTETGRYHFIDSWDNFDWYLEVISLGNRVGQWYWYTEEGYNVQYYRDGWLNDEDIYEWSEWQSDVTWETLQHQLDTLESNISNSYAPKTHTHLNGVSIVSSMTFKEWLDSRRTKGYIQYIATSQSDNGKYIVTFHYNASIKDLSYVYYQEYFDLAEPSKIYKRIGIATSNSNNATVNWQPWYVFEGKQVEE